MKNMRRTAGHNWTENKSSKDEKHEKNSRIHFGQRITAAEMKYMRRTAGHTWTDYPKTRSK